MCGIVGYWGPPDRGLLEAMAGVIRHRGPDDDGFSETDDVSIGYRRLSIIDLEHGQQPMPNEDGSVQVVHNGEIYNYRELRDELVAAGHVFRTQSDTEVIAHAYEEWGPQCFERFNGMWGIALLDRRAAKPKLVLSRDHFGIKPLYYARAGERFLFASEIKSLLQDPALRPAPNDQRIYEYLVLGLHDHDERTFFEGVYQLPAATYAVVDESGFEQRTYWEPRLSGESSTEPAAFRGLWKKAVERRLVADVPVGTCLSGGLDSSSIVCLMSELLEEHVEDAASLGDRIKTFSAVFGDDPIDEREYIEEVVEATGVDGHYVEPKSEEFFAELERVVWHQEEPMVSTGPYAQWCVMRLAAPHVKVLLDGQGGDELLAGYVPYQYVYLRQLLREGRRADFAREAWAARDVLAPLVRQRVAERRKAVSIARLLRPEFRAAVAPVRDSRSQDDLKLRLLQDLTNYSLPSLLRYEDRNSMAFSIESRVPYLDPQLVEHILGLPPAAIVRDGWSRAILRDSMRGVLPEKIRRRRWKVGFTTPEMRWLKARRTSVQSLFRSPAFCGRRYWNGLAIADAFREACQGRLEESLFFWRAMNLEVWLRVFFDGAGRVNNRMAPAIGFVTLGDRETVAALDGDASGAFYSFRPNRGRHLFARSRNGAVYARAPLQTPRVGPGDDLEQVVVNAVSGNGRVRPGDIVAVSEKAVAVSQGRSRPVEEIHPGRLATFLSRFVRRTPVGIGLGIPATMHLAIEEVGAPRILMATAASALSRPFGLKGVFYRVAGPQVAAIDGPTRGTLPPYDTHAKLPPAAPDEVAGRLARALSDLAGGPVEVAVIDANDLGVELLGHSAGVDRELVLSLLQDNPLGQGSEQTPIALIRRVAG
jgi:asparagine synthase (glutamine-hydrolysing)